MGYAQHPDSTWRLTALPLCARSVTAFAADSSRGFKFNLGRSLGGEDIMCKFFNAALWLACITCRRLGWAQRLLSSGAGRVQFEGF